MTGADTTPGARPAAPTDPRGIVLTDLIARLAVAVTECARRYEAAAGQTEGALRQALEGLGHAKRAQAADLAPLTRALGQSAAPEPGTPAPSTIAWGVLLGEAFQGERRLGRLAEELVPLAPDPLIAALATRLATGAARDGAEVRRLYLRYT